MGQKISVLTPEQLLGPLNDVESKFAPPKLYAAGPMETPLPRPRTAIIGSRKRPSTLPGRLPKGEWWS